MQSRETIQRAARAMQPYQWPANAQLASLHAECDLVGQVATAAFGGLLCAQPQHNQPLAETLRFNPLSHIQEHAMQLNCRAR